MELASTVDEVAMTVTALIDGFSRKGVGGRVTAVDVQPPAATLDPAETLQLDAIARNAIGDPVARRLVWASLDPSVATVDAAGLVTAVAAGTNPSYDWSWRIVTEPVATTPALFDEALNPDLNGDQNNPTPVGTLELGENLIRGTHALVESGSGQGDSYSVSVPAGLQIVGVELTVSNLSGFVGSTFTTADVFALGPLAGLAEFSPITTAQTIPFDGIVPLAGARDYMFSVQYAVVEPGTNPSYDWSWRIVTEPASE